MNEVGTYQNRKVIWASYEELIAGKMPQSDWICLMTSSQSKPGYDTFEGFTRNAIQHGILEFKGHGKFGELLHDWFDGTMVVMEAMEGHPEVEVMTTWHNDDSLAEVFWQCFFATCLPETTDYDKLKVVCTDLDGRDMAEELSSYLSRFEHGWLPKD